VKNRFEPEKYHDLKIVTDGNKTVGHIRVKPSGVLWVPKNAKKWYGVDLDKFAGFMEREGKLQDK